MRYVAPIALGTVMVLLAIAGAAAGSHPASQHASDRASTSLAAIGSFILPPHGIALWMHPTQAPITISANAVGHLKVCEVGTTFSTYWRGECRSLRRGKLALPSTGGAVHVGFWIRAASTNAVRVSASVCAGTVLTTSSSCNAPAPTSGSPLRSSSIVRGNLWRL